MWRDMASLYGDIKYGSLHLLDMYRATIDHTTIKNDATQRWKASKPGGTTGLAIGAALVGVGERAREVRHVWPGVALERPQLREASRIVHHVDEGGGVDLVARAHGELPQVDEHPRELTHTRQGECRVGAHR